MYKITTAVVAFAMLAVACSGSGTATTSVAPSTLSSGRPTTTIDPNQDIVFGSGSIPDTVPADFPFPAEAVIGSTLIDRTRNLTEVIFRVPASVAALGAFFDDNLPGRGYTVDASAGGDTAWEVEFTGESATGTIAITLGNQTVAQAVLRITTSG